MIYLENKRVCLRMCIACREIKPKEDLIRIVKNKTNEVFLDIYGKAPGRGVYICKNVHCFNDTKKRKKLEKAFKSLIDRNIYDSLEEFLGGKNDQ